MKAYRQNKILEIVSSRTIETQEELAEFLRSEGVNATQATLSRDIKEMRPQKVATADGGYRYLPPDKPNDADLDDRLHKIFRQSVISVNSAMNIVVLKTMPALASAACSAVDSMHLEYVLGTLAGDDTGMLIVKDEESARQLKEKLDLFIH